ncbi:hypothetical protein [Taibaiella koreensis]|uniref:hypothetical protein n=1 Tax=Taibaiella koreensis TaxID=1268548 RepID=UPI0013C3644D|nr:hypothetical protein [Taibaiella koreensis]
MNAIITVEDLLNLILDYNYLWCLPDRRHSRPAMARQARIGALQAAFGLTKKQINPAVQIVYSFGGGKQDRAGRLSQLSDLQYLLHGEFLHDREESANAALHAKIKEKITELEPELMADIREKPADIAWLFNHLLRFRQEVFKLTYPNAGMLEGFSAGLHYSYYLQRQLKEVIAGNLSEIDETLCLILDPAKRTFSREEIGYPDTDLDRIDLEWRIESD